MGDTSRVQTKEQLRLTSIARKEAKAAQKALRSRSLSTRKKSPSKATSLPEKKIRKRLSLEQKSGQQLRKVADEWFSWAIRLRDSELKDGAYWGKCITCTYSGRVAWLDETGKLRFLPGWDAGHFIGRGNKFLRYSEENVNLQCSYHCNRLNSGNIERYKPALDLKYGEGTWQRLSKEAQEHKVWPIKKPTYLEIISDYKAQVEFYKSQLVT